MNRSFRYLTLIALSFTLTGCASSKIFKTADLEKNSIFVDARHRALVTAKYPDTEAKESNRNFMICAEPSPDVFSTISSSLTGSGTFSQVDKDVALQYAASIAESGLDIGLRTQTIQVLRDMMYRLCERYMNGAISKIEFQQQAARDQRLIVSVLAIEQLTGAVRPQKAGISATTSVERGKDLLKAQETLTLAIAERGKKEKALNELRVTNEPLATAIEQSTAASAAAGADVKAKEALLPPLVETAKKSKKAFDDKNAEYIAAKKNSDAAKDDTAKAKVTADLLIERNALEVPHTADAKKVTNAKNVINTAKGVATKATAKLATDTNAATESTTAITAAEKALAQATDNVKTTQKLRDAADSIASAAGGTITFQGAESSNRGLDAAAIGTLSGAVNQIVKETFDDDELARTCLSLLRDDADKKTNAVPNTNNSLSTLDIGKENTPAERCFAYIEGRAQDKAKIKKLELIAQLSKDGKPLSKEAIEMILQ